MNKSNIVLQARQIHKSFIDVKNQVDVLKNIDIELKAGEFTAVVGASGSGKSTLLHILGGLELPSSGEVEVCGQLMNRLGEAERGHVRNQHIGFVYQFHHLLAEFSALENVAMPLMLRKEVEWGEAQSKAESLLETVGLSHRLSHQPGELSGGERQRVALARALVTSPSFILADEPTGNLDHQTASGIFDLLQHLKQELSMAMLIVTHDRALAKLADRTLSMRDGQWLTD